MMRTVSIFDIDLPPGVAFIRSLARAGIPVVAYSSSATAAGRLSRYARNFRSCPPVSHTDEFIDWIAARVEDGTVDLVAPTSDFVMFCLAAALDKLGGDGHDVGHPRPDSVRTCLFKDRFHPATRRAGFPAAEAATPLSVDDALTDAGRIGYPVVIKPRSHVGVGPRRGVVVRRSRRDGLVLRVLPDR